MCILDAQSACVSCRARGRGVEWMCADGYTSMLKCAGSERMKRRFLSWDCAHKTLAWAYFDIDLSIYAKLQIIADNLVNTINRYGGMHLFVRSPDFVDELSAAVDTITYFLDNFLTILSVGMADVLAGKKINDTTEVERTHALYAFLETHTELANTRVLERSIADKMHVTTLIEHQPDKMPMGMNSCSNAKSTMVSSQLLFYYIRLNPVTVSPKIKNTLALGPKLDFSAFIRGSDQNAKYNARKAHACANFRHLLTVFEIHECCVGIPNSKINNPADAMMQALAYMIKNRQFC